MDNINSVLPKNKYLELSEQGSRLNLSFTSHLDLGKKIIGLDGLKKCLLVLDTSSEVKSAIMIDLNEVTSIIVKKDYGSISREQLNYKGLGHFLEKIDLKFELGNGKETVVLPFYDCNEDKQADPGKIEKNADNWKKVLSKMLGRRPQKQLL